MVAVVSPLLVVAWHTLVIYAFLIYYLVRFGRREAAQTTFVEFVVIMVLGSAVETAMVAGNTSLPAGLVSASVLLLANRLLTVALRRSKRVRRLLLHGPVMLVHEGRFVASAAHRVGLTEADVLIAIRERGFSDFSEVRLAVFEMDGSIGVVPMSARVHQGARAVRRDRSASPSAAQSDPVANSTS